MLFKFKKSFFLFIILWGYIVSFSAVANAMSDEDDIRNFEVSGLVKLIPDISRIRITDFNLAPTITVKREIDYYPASQINRPSKPTRPETSKSTPFNLPTF